jgi:hypothetical protein
MIDAIKMYNDLIPTMNKLSEDGYSTECHHNKYEGYGFYVEGANSHYIHIRFSDKCYITLNKREGKYRHDPINDIRVETFSTEDKLEAIEQITLFLEQCEHLEKEYDLKLTKSDIEHLLFVCSDQSIIDKLNKALEE